MIAGNRCQDLAARNSRLTSQSGEELSFRVNKATPIGMWRKKAVSEASQELDREHDQRHGEIQIDPLSEIRRMDRGHSADLGLMPLFEPLKERHDN